MSERIKLLVQTYLETHSLAELRKQHGVKHRWSTQRPGVFTLNYDQLEVCDTDPLSQECRGLILRMRHLYDAADHDGAPMDSLVIGETEIVALPFARFFNHGTGPCADVDLGNARFYEKLDGTLCIVHHDGGAWHVATRGVPDADVPIDHHEGTFRTLFERALRECGERYGLATELGQGLDPERTYLFELTAPENQVVVKYDDRAVSLLGIRHRKTGHEYPPEMLGDLYLVCPSHRVEPATLSDFVHTRDPMQHEGLVVCDDLFRRAKVKSAGYLALAHVRDSVGSSDRRLLELVLNDRHESAEIQNLLPRSLKTRLVEVSIGLGLYLSAADRWYEANVTPGDRKAFALRIQHGGEWMAAHMHRFSGKSTSARGFVQSAKREGTWPDTFLDHLLEGAAEALTEHSLCENAENCHGLATGYDPEGVGLCDECGGPRETSHDDQESDAGDVDRMLALEAQERHRDPAYTRLEEG